jgi:cobalt/nickel transport system permease protein
MQITRSRRFLVFGLSLVLFLGIPSYAFAMHISEGILPLPWAGLWLALAAVFVGVGIVKVKKCKEKTPAYMPLLGIMGAAVFVISCLPVPVPIAGTCSHPCGTGISAILVGPFPSIVISAIALLIQALFLAHGGLTTLGANIISMGVAGSFAGYGAYKGLLRSGAPVALSAFAAGFVADLATYATTSVELALGIHGSHSVSAVALKIFVAFLPTQLPLATLEGLIAAGMVIYVLKHRPEILHKLGLAKLKTEVARNEL